MLTIIIHILIVALILGLIFWAAGLIPPLVPFLSIVRVVVIVLFVIWVILQLVPLLGGHF